MTIEKELPDQFLGFGTWLEAASKRLHSNVLVVALAAKLARAAWSRLAQTASFLCRSLLQRGRGP